MLTRRPPLSTCLPESRQAESTILGRALTRVSCLLKNRLLLAAACGLLLITGPAQSPAQAQVGISVQSNWIGPGGGGFFAAGTVRVGGWGVGPGVWGGRPWGWGGGPWGWGGNPWGWGGVSAWGWGTPFNPWMQTWSPLPVFSPQIVVPPLAPSIWVAPWAIAPPPVLFAPWPVNFVGWGGWNLAPFAAVPIGPQVAWNNWINQRPLDGLQGAPLPPPRAANDEALARAARFCEIGDRYFDEQNFRKAYVRYDQATDAAPNSVAAQLRKGQTLIALGNYEMAARAFKTAVRTANWTGCPLRWNDIYGKNQAAKDTHLQALAAACQNDPDNADLMFLLGMELFFDDQIPRSVKFFQRYAALRDGDPQVARQLNVALNGNEQVADAVAVDDLGNDAGNGAVVLPVPQDARPLPQPPPAIGEARQF